VFVTVRCVRGRYTDVPGFGRCLRNLIFVVANEARGVRRGGDANNDGVDFRMGSARRASSTRPAESRARPNERAPLEISCAI